MLLVADAIQDFSLKVSPETDLTEIINLIEKLREDNFIFQQLFVVDKLKLLGIIRIIDLVCLINSERKIEEIKVVDIIKPAITLNSDYEYHQALSLMQDNNILYLPVVDESGKILEIVNLRDIAQKIENKKNKHQKLA
ncbi:MAG: CBS domain-containing protein, partial [Cyanobacteria bacterium J06632_19]